MDRAPQQRRPLRQWEGGSRLLLFCTAGWLGSFMVLWVLLQLLLEPLISEEISDRLAKNVRLVEGVLDRIDRSQLPIGVTVSEGVNPPTTKTAKLDHFDREMIENLRSRHQLRNPIVKASDVELAGLSGYWVRLEPNADRKLYWLYVPSRLATSTWFWPLQSSLTALLGTLIGTLAYLHCCVNQPLRELTRRLPARQLPSVFDLLPEQGIRPIRDLSLRINRLLSTLNANAADRYRLLRGLVHDLRGPLTRLLVRTETLACSQTGCRETGLHDSGSRQAEIRETVVGLQADLQILRDLIAQLASLASEDKPKPGVRPLALEDFLENVIASYPASAKLRLQVPRFVVALDPQLLQRTLCNLIDNAIEYGAPPIRLSACCEKQRLVIQIEDHGPGLSSYEQLSGLYQPQAHNRGLRGHSGLGLAIAERFCRQHGGRLHLEPSPLGGLRVQLRLPRSVLISGQP